MAKYCNIEALELMLALFNPFPFTGGRLEISTFCHVAIKKSLFKNASANFNYFGQFFSSHIRVNLGEVKIKFAVRP